MCETLRLGVCGRAGPRSRCRKEGVRVPTVETSVEDSQRLGRHQGWTGVDHWVCRYLVGDHTKTSFARSVKDWLPGSGGKRKPLEVRDGWVSLCGVLSLFPDRRPQDPPESPSTTSPPTADTHRSGLVTRGVKPAAFLLVCTSRVTPSDSPVWSGRDGTHDYFRRFTPFPSPPPYPVLPDRTVSGGIVK